MRERIGSADIDRIAMEGGTDAGIWAVWNRFLSLAGTDATGVVFSEGTDAFRLAGTYRARAGVYRGCECGGCEETVGALEAARFTVRLALLKTPRYLGVCFLTPPADRLIGFLYVRHEEHLAL